MDNKTFNKLNVLFIETGCPHCRLTLFTEKINQKLPVKERIKIVDCEYYTKYGIVTDPLINLFSKHISGFPTLFIRGKVVNGVNTKIEYETLLNAIFHELYIVPEENEFIWRGDCEYTKNKLFNKVICK